MALRSAWTRYGDILLVVVAAHAALTAALRLPGAFDSLILGPDGPVDLLIRREEVLRWFDGVTIYLEPLSADYPPGSYALLWLLVGWLPELPARAFFAATTGAAFLAIAVIGVRASHAERLPEKAFVALLVLPLGATQITVWIGQLGLHVVACLMGATLLLFGARERPDGKRGSRRETWPVDLAAAALLTASLIKPTLSVPVVAAILIGAWRWRPLMLTVAMYGGVTLVAAAFQDPSPIALVQMWLGRESILDMRWGSVNLHLWLHWLGIDGSLLPASLACLLASCLWVWRYRRVDPWVLVGVAALVGRLWIHHRPHDDLLLVIGLLALFRIAKAPSAPASAVPLVAALLIALAYGLGHAPWSYLSRESRALWLLTEGGRTIVWAALLAFLVGRAHTLASRPRELDAPTG